MVVAKGLVPEEIIESQPGTPLAEAADLFITHVRIHSPDKPRTVEQCKIVLVHFQEVMGKKRLVETIQRKDIEAYKAHRASGEKGGRTGGPITPSTTNFEISTLRTFFNYLIREQGIVMRIRARTSSRCVMRRRAAAAVRRHTPRMNSIGCSGYATVLIARPSPPSCSQAFGNRNSAFSPGRTSAYARERSTSESARSRGSRPRTTRPATSQSRRISRPSSAFSQRNRNGSSRTPRGNSRITFSAA